MRDSCRKGGTVVGAAVAAIEQQTIVDNDISSTGKVRVNCYQNRREGVPNCYEIAYSGNAIDRENADPSLDTSKNDESTMINFSCTNARYLETGKSSSPASKNIQCLEEAASSDTSQFRSRNAVNYIDRIVSDRSDFEKYLCEKDGARVDNFEEAVKDFDVTANDVQNFLSKYSLKGLRDLTINTEGAEGQNAQTASDNLTGNCSDTDSSEIGSSSDTDSESESEDEHVINEGLETITEEPSGRLSVPGGDSSTPDEDATVKGDAVWSGSTSNQGSTSDLSSSSSDRPKSLKDSSTRCNDDFQWIRQEPVETSTVTTAKMEEQIPQSKPPLSSRPVREKPQRKQTERQAAPGSLDRRRNNHHQNRHERDQKSRSTHLIKSPPRFDDYVQHQACQNWCCNPHFNEQTCFDNFHRRHERIDPQRYGSSPMLMEQRFGGERGSHPDLYGDFSRFRHEQPYGCCSYHTAPPCCFYGDARNFHWTPPSYPVNKGPDHDDKLRKLQTEKDNLQLQVQVLSEQIEAQTDKISDLEKTLIDKKQQLTSSEDMLQREILSRSSLETQKLELMSAISELKLHQAALERENLELRSSRFNNNTTSSIGAVTKPPSRSRITTQPQHSTPILHNNNQSLSPRLSPSPSPVPSGHSPRKLDTQVPILQDVMQPPKTPPATYRRQIDIHYGSLPRQQFLSNGELVPMIDSNANPANGSRKGVAFGRGFTSLLGVRARGCSVPNLAETERIIIDDTSDGSPQSPTIQFNKNKGIKKIFGRMKRSGSGNLEDLPGLSEFQRGGVRATAAARLGWSEPEISLRPDKPFVEWDTENICDWLQDLGLEQYISEAKRWIKNGQQLQEAPIQEIEKELAIKNVLHRKKLQLAIIDSIENGTVDPFLAKAGKLDTAWVLRWLDDTGLPQHKEAFLLNRVDGRVLHRLTIDDLAVLHVSSLLHVASLKRGIQVLRDNEFEPGCLQRRSLPDDLDHPTPKHICLWTTHRVMEWLRAVDLAEYAPNLRGAGVHGGLMVLEDKFTSELLATLLNIPPGKTLLRRHLNTHFKELLGKDIIQEKRESEATLGYIPLTPSAKLKVSKKSQFSLKRKKSKGEMDYGDLVCSLNPNNEDGKSRRSKRRGCLSSH